MLKDFLVPGKASFILGGGWGSEGKGAAAAWVASELNVPCQSCKDGRLYGQPCTDCMNTGYENGGGRFDVATTNAGCQSGHTSVHGNVTNVVFHLPTAPLIAPGSIGYLNAGAVIDLDVLTRELEVHGHNFSQFYIHPNAAIITSDCKIAEGRADSAQTRIASTRKGVGEALARKVLRSGVSVNTYSNGALNLVPRAEIYRFGLCREMSRGKSVLVEVPQGIGLSLNGPFYPHCTSRDCTVMQAASDAQIHPSFVGPVMLVLRTFPIRVGGIYDGPTDTVHSSGGCYPDQRETTWDELGVPPEITTVTKRVRRVFTWSHQQVRDAFISARPTHVFLSHVDYLKPKDNQLGSNDLRSYVLSLQTAAAEVGIPMPQLFYSTGPTTADVREWTP